MTQKRHLLGGIVNGIKDMFSSSNLKDGGVQVLSKEEAKRRLSEQNREQRPDTKEALNQMIDQSIGKSRGISGFLFGKFAKFFAGRMIDMASKQYEALDFVTEEAVAKLEVNSKSKAILGENIEFEMIQGYNNTVLNSTSAVDIRFTVVGSKGRGLIELRAEDMLITSLKCTGSDGKGFFIISDEHDTSRVKSSQSGERDKSRGGSNMYDDDATSSSPKVIDVQSWDRSKSNR